MDIILVPLAFILAIPLTIWAASYYKHKNQKMNTEILTILANKGEPITPEIIQSFGVRKNPKDHDLRRGVILIALAIATYIMGRLATDDTQNLLTGLAMLPLFIGIAYTGLWAFVSRKDT